MIVCLTGDLTCAPKNKSENQLFTNDGGECIPVYITVRTTTTKTTTTTTTIMANVSDSSKLGHALENAD